MTFWNVTIASHAKNRLEENGIKAFLEGEQLATMNWSLSNAVGGIGLVVQAQDAERAMELLGEHVNEADLDQASSEAMDAEPETEDEKPSPAPEQVHEIESPLSTREAIAERAWKGAVLGLAMLPLQIYVLFLLFKVYASQEPLRDAYRTKVMIASLINLPLMFTFGLLMVKFAGF